MCINFTFAEKFQIIFKKVTKRFNCIIRVSTATSVILSYTTTKQWKLNL